MSRRTLTLLVGGALAVVVTLALAIAPVPYVALGPGPTYNTLGTDDTGKPVISVTGRPTYPDGGHLNMTTISVVPQLTLAQALRGWWQRTVAVVPRDVIYPPSETAQQVQKQDIAAMQQSQDSATTAALRYLKVPGTVHVLVDTVAPGAPATGILRPGDELVSVDGRPVTGGAQLRDLIRARSPGQSVRIGYVRGGRPAQATIVTGSSGVGSSAHAIIGVVTRDRTDFPVKVTIRLADVGGPSAGLMFALGVVDLLTPGSLTDGRFIAGTGTIDSSGKVGPIGGIQQKLVGARQKGATVFLVPAQNCADALSSPPPGLRLVKVGSLADALGELHRLDAGQPTTPCTK